MSGAVETRAGNEFGCGSVDVEELGSQSYRANGCGRTAIYTCVRTGWGGVVCEHDEAVHSSSSTSRTTNTANATVAERRPGQAAPPTGAAGFNFGITPEQAKTACEEAGHVFSGTECDGLAVDLGQSGRARFRFCTGKLCAITITLEHKGETLEQSVIRWKRGLVDKYGAPWKNDSTMPPGCSDLANCVATHLGSVRIAWTWPSHHAIELTTPERDTADAIRVELLYTSPSTVVTGL